MRGSAPTSEVKLSKAPDALSSGMNSAALTGNVHVETICCYVHVPD